MHRLNPNANAVPAPATPAIDSSGSVAASPTPYRPRQGGAGACAFCGATMVGRFCSDCGRSRSDVLPPRPANDAELGEGAGHRAWWPPTFGWSHSPLTLPVGIAITIVTMAVSAIAASSQGPIVHIRALTTAAVSTPAPAQVVTAPHAKPSPSAATSSQAAAVASKSAPVIGPNAATVTAPAVDFADHPIDDPDVAAKSGQTIYIGALKVRHPKTAASAAPTANACSTAASAVADVYGAIVQAMGKGNLTGAAPAIAAGVVTIRAAAKTATDAGQVQAMTAVAARGQDLHDFMVGVRTATWPNLVSTSFDKATDSLDATCSPS